MSVSFFKIGNSLGPELESVTLKHDYAVCEINVDGY